MEKGLLVKIPKKGDITQCNNWRGLTLLSVRSKVLNRFVLSRIKSVIEKPLQKEHASFQSNRSCVDHRTKMWNIMKKYGIPKHIIDLK
jgi:hypothetical protein